MLKSIRVTLAVLVTGLLSLFFLDYLQIMPAELHFLAHVQFVEAFFTMLGGNFVAIAFLLIITLLFGRIYCSVICPLGVLQDFIFWLHKRVNKKKWLKYAKPLSIMRYVFLVIMLISMNIGVGLVVSLLAPYASFGRIMTHLFMPIVLFINNLLAVLFEYTGDYYLIETEIAIASLTAFITAVVSFVVVAVLSWTNGRAFCNSVCPVGTVLGLLSRVSLLKVRVNQDKCNSCGLCERNCKAKCINSKEKTIDASRCVDCFNCLKKCNKGALSFARKSHNAGHNHLKFSQRGAPHSGNASPTEFSSSQVQPPIQAERRDLLIKLSAITAGSVLLPKVLVGQNTAQHSIGTTTYKGIPITPPGSLSYDNFRQKCTACHLCVSKCPTKVLQPAKLEYGWGGIMQPTLKYENGYCQYDCDICSRVCPSTAINRFHDIRDKLHTQIGVACYTAKHCQVTELGISCGICSKNCPTKAITLIPSPNNDKLYIPQVNTTLCIGCGACEYYCPTDVARKAMKVDGMKVHHRIRRRY